MPEEARVLACLLPDGAGALLLSRAAMACPGGQGTGRALAYRLAWREGLPGFVVPSTGRLLTASPDGGISADRDVQGGWEMFELQPSSASVEAPPVAGANPAALAAYAGAEGFDPEVMIALLRLPDSDGLRRLAARLHGLACYEVVFPLLRRALSPARAEFEWLTRRRLADGIEAHGWVVGAHTYGAPEVIDGQYGQLEIGSYCSIAGQVQIVVANHATASVTSYPFAALSDFWPSADPAAEDHVSRGVVIGSDVWIGTGACILPGARIGDGAVLGARCVVAGTVPPYAVVVGNPARVVRRRFAEAQVTALLALRWWSWPEHVVDRFVPLLLAGEVDAFLAAAREAGLAPEEPRRPGGGGS